MAMLAGLRLHSVGRMWIMSAHSVEGGKVGCPHLGHGARMECWRSGWRPGFAKWRATWPDEGESLAKSLTDDANGKSLWTDVTVQVGSI